MTKEQLRTFMNDTCYSISVESYAEFNKQKEAIIEKSASSMDAYGEIDLLAQEFLIKNLIDTFIETMIKLFPNIVDE